MTSASHSSDLPTGLSQPSLRALAGAGISRLDQLTNKTEAEIATLHGMGPKGIRILRSALAERGLTFRPKPKAPRATAAAPTAAGTPAHTPSTVDAYLADLPDDQRAALQRLRETIRAAAPKATEVISYGIPIFKLGRGLVGFNASKSYCTFQLMGTAVLEAHAAELPGYRTGKGSIQFTPDRPLPTALIKKLVKARIAENERLAAAPKR